MEGPESRILQAREVYVLMKKDYRISRNIRASWFFNHLNKTLPFTPSENLGDTDEELQVASVVSDDGTPCELGKQYNVALLPSTMVTFVARRYRFVIILDLSPSICSVDTSSSSVLYEKVHKVLGNFLRGLVLPFRLPSSYALLSPEIHITVKAYSPVKCFMSNQVLVQGMIINCNNIESVIHDLAVKLEKFETVLASNFSKLIESNNSHFASSNFEGLAGMFGHTGSPLPKEGDTVNNPETGFVNMIRSGLLALQLLPENSTAGLVVITDGCLGLLDASLFEYLLSQLRTSTTSCSFLRVGAPRSPFGHFGHIPHTELMQFIATATFGSYFDSCPDISNNETKELNAYHKAVFLWSFQKGLEGFRFDLGDQNLMVQPSSPAQLVQGLLSHPIHGKLASVMPNIRKRQFERSLNTSLFSVLSVRLREGYIIREMAITKGETQIEVRMVLPLREYARFEYLVRAAWPLDSERSITHSEIILEGSYDFLHDMSCEKINSNAMSAFRFANVKKVKLALQGLSDTDQLLVHLQSFSSNPVYYTLPDSIKNGVPLFYLSHPNSTVPSLSTQLNSKDPIMSQFASFWRPIVNLDMKIWQKWMHSHRIGLVLEHDVPLHKNIHIPNSSGRYSTVICRQAVMALNVFLTEWSTFVMLDGQSYIKLLFESEKPATPFSFLLLRVTSKAPCLVLRLDFLGGTPGYQRHKIVEEIKARVAKLKFRERGPKTDKNRRVPHGVKQEDKEKVKKPPLMREWSEITCCVLLKKPVESVLIRYEGMPRDMTRLEDQEKKVSHFIMSPQAQAKNMSAVNLFNSLSRYLLHQRWIWTVQQPGVNSINMSGIGRILSTLAKMRIQQGFHFSLTNSGIVNMMLEVDMKHPDQDGSVGKKHQSSCVVQYILFPPYLKTTSDNISDDEGDLIEATEDDGELQIILECWVEPQYGICTNNTPERSQLEGLSCSQIPGAFYQDDIKCVSSLITFEHLMYLCQNSAIPCDLSTIVNEQCHYSATVTALSPTVQQIAFPFDLLSLLPRSQQAEFVYPTYSYYADAIRADGLRSPKEANEILLSILFEELRTVSHKEVLLSRAKSLHFLQTIYARDRNEEMNPFPVDFLHYVQQQGLKGTETAPMAGAAPLNKSRQDKPNAKKGLSDPVNPAGKDAGSCLKDAFDVSIPQWKCFVKAVSPGALVLTFIPAAFEDLLLLNKTGCDNLRGTKNLDEKGCKDTLKSCNNTPDSSSAVPEKPVTVESETNNKNTANNQITDKIDGSAEGQAVTNTPDSLDLFELKHSPELDESNRDKEPEMIGLKVPVYVYDCIMHNLTNSLINPWDFQLPSDLYQDMTFDQQPEVVEEIALPSPRGKRVTFNVDSVKNEDEDVTMSRSHERRSTEGSNEGGENLWQHCSFLSETYYNCYVKGVFQSLQKGYEISGQDVDAAINNICEEGLPLETNITTFLHASCSHFQHLVNEVRRDSDREEQIKAEVIEETRSRRPSVCFADMVEDDLVTEADPNNIPTVLEIPHSKMKPDLQTLHLDLPCNPAKDLHHLIKDKFLDTIQKWFQPVPSSPDYYFYCPNTPFLDDTNDERETTTSDVIVPPTGTDVPETDGSIGVPVLQHRSANKNEKGSTASELDSDESSLGDLDSDLEPMEEEDQSNRFPLFLNFTCTVKSGLQQYSVSLRNIAACLSELSSVLGNLSEIDIGDLKITFDLNCLTLPNDLDISSPRKLSFHRQVSTERTSFSSAESVEVTERANSSVYEVKGLKDPIGHLPSGQQDAVTKCMEEIKWLLRDEIVSNLRHISPIKSDALNYVSKHIQTSTGKANVYMDNVPLQFVYGPDQSAGKFIEEFQEMNLQNYQLVKEEEWYYLARKRRTTYSYVNALALSSALSQLNQSTGKLVPIPRNALSPRDKVILSPSVRSDGAEVPGDGRNVKNPFLAPNPKEKMFDIGSEHFGQSSPVTVKSDQPDYNKRHSRESSLGTSKKVTLSTETGSVSLDELRLGLVNPRRSTELMLKIVKDGEEDEPEQGQSKDSGESYGIDKKSPKTAENMDLVKNSDAGFHKQYPEEMGRVADTSPKELTKHTRDGELGSETRIASMFRPIESIRQSFSPARRDSDGVIQMDVKDNSPVTSPEEKTGPLGSKSIESTPAGRPAEAGLRKTLQKRVSLDSPDSLQGEGIKHFTNNSVLSSRSFNPVSPLTVQCGIGSLPSTPTQTTPNVYSPVNTDVSIQLTKIDGRSEPYQTSPERDVSNDSELCSSLKRCSSFAGFHSNESCEPMKTDISVSQVQSPMKPLGYIAHGFVGRARHFSAPLSGHGTPKSRVSTLPPTPSYDSSQGSFTEDAYDGDMSEIDDAATVYSEMGVVTRLMPEFWLIMQINTTAVDILYQHSDLELDGRRETGKESKEDKFDQRSLLTQVKEHVENTCRKVNQQLLLNNLYETRVCHPLLVDAADEDVSWAIDKGPKYRKLSGTNISSSENDDDEDEDSCEQKYLALAMEFDPGHFDCPCVWKHVFYIHPGLKRGTGRGSVMSMGVKALRTALIPFSVKNRNNMFVIKETDGNVFYLRLKEIHVGTGRPGLPPNDSTDSLSLSMSSGFKQEMGDTLTVPEHDPDTISQCSSSGAFSQAQQSHPTQDCVELNVHGIEEAGPEIKETFVHMLQKKLDDSALDKVVEMLRRNPLCQLERDDVQFIQKPYSSPTATLHLTLSPKANGHIGALMFYLRQNLLQFLNTPKYKTSNQDHHFMDTYNGEWTSIPSDLVYLFIPKHMRVNGIACVSVCLVDGLGNFVKLLPSSKPSGSAYTEINSKEDLESFIVTQEYTMNPESKKPGPTALVQFRIWSIGDLEHSLLMDKLRSCLGIALCDVLIEYYLLTAPICEIPKHLLELAPPPYTLSAPSSPYCSSPQVDEFRERKLSMVALRKPADTHQQLERRASVQAHFKFPFHMKDALFGKKMISLSPDTTKSCDLSASLDLSSNRASELGSVFGCYEMGDRGTLHQIYSDLMEDWLAQCHSYGSTAITKINRVLKSKFSVDFVLQEFQNMISHIYSGTTTKVYKLLPSEEEDGNSNIGILYHPNRSPLECGRRRSETSLDMCPTKSFVPGEEGNYVAVSRDMTQWNSYIQHTSDEGDCTELHNPTKRGNQPTQKFAPLLPNDGTDMKSSNQNLATAPSTSFIPRQRFLMLSLKDKQIQVFTYNWTTDNVALLNKMLNKLVNWSNARTQLLSNVVIQKCGLFSHFLFSEGSLLDKMSQQMDHLDQLIDNPAPPPPNKDRLSRSHSTSSVRDTNFLPLDLTFKDLYPSKPLHMSHLACENDVVKQYGRQVQDIRLNYKREFEKINSIRNLYVMWVQKTSPIYPIGEDIIRTLKQASRLFHYCATPLLFSTKWRQNVIEKYKVTRQGSVTSVSSTATPDLKSRSRHGSGTSVGSNRAKRTDTPDIKKHPSLPSFKELDEKEYTDEKWHLELRARFIRQYIEYLNTIGFNYVQLSKLQDGSNAQRNRQAKFSEEIKPPMEETEFKPTDIHNLQKTVSGGILLIELSFRQEYFCVKLYTCDNNKLGITVNQQKFNFGERRHFANLTELKLLYVDECEKCKDLIHVHSFAHDFHLRCIQSYIEGNQGILTPNYYLTGLLEDFVKVYPYAPSFSRNFMQRDVVTIPEPSCTSTDLYDYMLRHAKLHAMSVLKMTLPPDSELQDILHLKNHQQALISHEQREITGAGSINANKHIENYKIGLVILQDSVTGTETVLGDKSALSLQCYIILTTSQLIFPRHSLEKDLGNLMSKNKQLDKVMVLSSCNEKGNDKVSVPQPHGLLKATTNYLGFSNKHQPPMYQLLQQEALLVSEKIKNMAVESMEKCRRDSLWNKMLIMISKSEDQSAEEKRKKRSDTDDSRGPVSRLSYEEFCELLDRVHKVPLDKLDKQLVPFQHMSLDWYKGLVSVLNTKYPETARGCFMGQTGSPEYHVILNPKALDLFMLLSIESTGGKGGLYVVFQEQALEQDNVGAEELSVPEENMQIHMKQFIEACCYHLLVPML